MSKTYMWQDGCGFVTLTLAQADVDSVCHSGPNDAQVDCLASRPDITEQLDCIPQARLVKALREYGAWDAAELADHEANKQRILWVACWGCFDDPEAHLLEDDEEVPA